MGRRRARVLLAVGVVIAGAAALVLTNVRSGLLYYVTPAELVQGGDRLVGKAIRLEGLVVPGTLRWDRTTLVTTFVLRDSAEKGGVMVPVTHRGSPPDLFREGRGAVVEGRWNGSVFQSTAILVKHDERYEPPKGEGK